MIEKSKSGVSIIGGADGPTSIFIAGKIQKKSLKVKSVDGDLIETNFSFNQMRQQIEYYITQFENVEIINSTRGGAHIQGSRYMILNDVIDNYLSNNIVDDEWYLNDENDCYDLEYLSKRKSLRSACFFSGAKNLITFLAVFSFSTKK